MSDINNSLWQLKRELKQVRYAKVGDLESNEPVQGNLSLHQLLL